MYEPMICLRTFCSKKWGYWHLQSHRQVTAHDTGHFQVSPILSEYTLTWSDELVMCAYTSQRGSQSYMTTVAEPFPVGRDSSMFPPPLPNGSRVGSSVVRMVREEGIDIDGWQWLQGCLEGKCEIISMYRCKLVPSIYSPLPALCITTNNTPTASPRPNRQYLLPHLRIIPWSSCHPHSSTQYSGEVRLVGTGNPCKSRMPHFI